MARRSDACDPLVYVLLAAALSAYVKAAVGLGVLAVNAAVGLIQETKVEAELIDGPTSRPQWSFENPLPSAPHRCTMRARPDTATAMEAAMAREPRVEGGIVVGIDGSPSSIAALEWALDEAEKTGATVRAVTAWEVPTNWSEPVPVYPGDHLDEDATERLAQVVDAATIGRRPVNMTRTVVKGHPARVLLDQSEGADLLVVGQRGLGRFAGTMLGSVSQKCLHHATCPVLVVRADD